MGNTSNKAATLNVEDKNAYKKLSKEKRKKKRGGWFRRSKKNRARKTTGGNNIVVTSKINSYDFVPPEKEIDPDEVVLGRLRKSLRTDLETFLLNNILMSVQFFENFEREMSVLRMSPVSDVEMERNELLSKYQKHCVSPDNLLETVSQRVRFRPQHGPKKHCTEYIHSPRLLVVQDNAELYDGTDTVDYSSVSDGPLYRLSMEQANMQGFVKLRYDDKRRPTYETILEKRRSEEEAAYSRILGDTPTPRDSDEKFDDNEEEEDIFEEMPQLSEGQKMMLELQEHLQETTKPTTPQLSEGQKMMLDLQEHLQESGKLDQAIAIPRDIGFVHGTTKTPTQNRHFGPQNSFSDPLRPMAAETPTERRLSGVIRTTKKLPMFTPPASSPNKYKRPNKMSPSKSMTDLTDGQTSNPQAGSSRGSPLSDSSGYKSGSSSSRTNLSLPNSRGSDVEYGYATIKSYTTPKPLGQLRLGNIPANSSTIPNGCFTSVDIALINKEDGKRRSENGTYILAEKLFETRHYLKSNAFIGNFADVFAEGLSQMLGITSETLAAATMQGAQIFYESLEQGPNLIPLKVHHRVIPTIASSSWPSAAFEWTIRQRKCVTDNTKHIAYTWPTQRMVRKIKSFGCHVLPEGFMPTRGQNSDKDLEWRLAFPEAERFLESCLSHAQVRCFVFTLALFKNFMEPVNAELSLSAGHIRTILLWQCEKNYVAWPEDRPGETLQKFLGVLYEALMKETLPDYFVKGQNQLEGIPRTHIRIVQERLCRVRENLIMHVLMMARNLRYVDENKFYPQLDYKRLYEIVTTENVVGLMNPLLARSVSQQEIESDSNGDDSDNDSVDDWWAEVRKNDPGRQWNKKVQRQIVAEKAAQKLTNEFTKKSVDSIDLLTIPGQAPDSLRRQMLLELLIPHFIQMAKRSNEFRAPKQSLMYIVHAERLTKLLGEETNNNGAARKLMFQIKNLRDGGKVGIDELRSPLEIQSYSKKLSFKSPESPTRKITMDLPPIPTSTGEAVTVHVHPPPSTTPVKRTEVFKRSSFVISKEDAAKNASLVQALHATTPIVTDITKNNVIANGSASIIIDEAVEEESTDF